MRSSRSRSPLTTESAARHALERLLRLPAAQREAAARSQLEARPPVLREVLRLLDHAELSERWLRPPSTIDVRFGGRASAVRGRVLASRWRLLAEIGRGGQGVVWRADDAVTRRHVAVKLVRGLSRSVRQQVRREAAALRWLRLPGVVRLLDDGEDGEDVWLAMEYVRGAPFPGRPRSRTWEAIEPAALGLFEALGRIHGAGVIHGDLKPHNVLVGSSGTVTVLDLGLSAARGEEPPASRAPVGFTLGYVAPECLSRSRRDVRSDLFAAGVLLFEALTGRRPDEEPRRSAALARVPPRIRRVIHRLLAPDPRSRPSSAVDVLQALHPPPATRRRRPWTERDLRKRFGGHDWFLHQRQDAARELHLRTLGVPAAVERELASWLRAGLARMEDGLVVLDRASLESLADLRHSQPPQGRDRDAGGPDAGSELALLLRRGPRDAVPAAALRAAREAMEAGHATRAISAMEAGATAARAIPDRRALESCLLLAVEASLDTASVREIDRALWLVQRTGFEDAWTRALAEVTKAASASMRGEWSDAFRRATRQSRTAPRAIRMLAWSVRALAAQALSLRHQARVVSEGEAWARRERSAAARAAALRWRAWLLYRKGRCAEAADLHLRSARSAPMVSRRLRSLVDAASASLDSGAIGAAERLAHHVRRTARRLRRPIQEARAHIILRAALDQRGVPLRQNLAPIAAVEALGMSSLAASARVDEAALAWHRGDPQAVQAILEPLLRHQEPSTMSINLVCAACLAAAAGLRPSPQRIQALAKRATEVGAPKLAAQLIALLSIAVPARQRSLRSRFRRLRIRDAEPEWSRRREFMSLAEVARVLGDR